MWKPTARKDKVMNGENMELRDVAQQDQFARYYDENNLNSAYDKIKHLKAAMKIRAVMRDKEISEEDELAGLEETALRGVWRASW